MDDLHNYPSFLFFLGGEGLFFTRQQDLWGTLVFPFPLLREGGEIFLVARATHALLILHLIRLGTRWVESRRHTSSHIYMVKWISQKPIFFSHFKRFFYSFFKKMYLYPKIYFLIWEVFKPPFGNIFWPLRPFFANDHVCHHHILLLLFRGHFSGNFPESLLFAPRLSSIPRHPKGGFFPADSSSFPLVSFEYTYSMANRGYTRIMVK